MRCLAGWLAGWAGFQDLQEEESITGLQTERSNWVAGQREDGCGLEVEVTLRIVVSGGGNKYRVHFQDRTGGKASCGNFIYFISHYSQTRAGSPDHY